MSRRGVLLLVAGLLAFGGFAALGVYIFATPTVLRIAVGPAGSEDTRVVVGLLQTFTREKQPVRLKLVSTEGPPAGADLLREGRVDLAIVRSDGSIPPNAATVAIMHRDAALLLAMPTAGIKSVADLAGRTIGIVGRGFTLNQRLLEFILVRNGIDPAHVKRELIRPNDVRASLKEGRISAVFVLGPPTGMAIPAIFSEMISAAGEPPIVIPLMNAEALVESNPVLVPHTILRGTFGGNPPQPAENVPSIGVTHRLVADRGLKESVVADLAKSLFEVRQAVAADVPMASRIEEPNTEVPGPLVVHPGAASYFDGEQQSFIEQYGEWVYIGGMLIGLVGSALAAMLSRFGERRLHGSGELDRMLLLLRRSRTAETSDTLDGIQNEADEALSRMMDRTAKARVDEPVLSAFTLALAEVRTAIDDRRRWLSQDGLT